VPLTLCRHRREKNRIAVAGVKSTFETLQTVEEILLANRKTKIKAIIQGSR
jgi:hypothetical protein